MFCALRLCAVLPELIVAAWWELLQFGPPRVTFTQLSRWLASREEDLVSPQVFELESRRVGADSERTVDADGVYRALVKGHGANSARVSVWRLLTHPSVGCDACLAPPSVRHARFMRRYSGLADTSPSLRLRVWRRACVFWHQKWWEMSELLPGYSHAATYGVADGDGEVHAHLRRTLAARSREEHMQFTLVRRWCGVPCARTHAFRALVSMSLLLLMCGGAWCGNVLLASIVCDLRGCASTSSCQDGRVRTRSFFYPQRMLVSFALSILLCAFTFLLLTSTAHAVNRWIDRAWIIVDEAQASAVTKIEEAVVQAVMGVQDDYAQQLQLDTLLLDQTPVGQLDDASQGLSAASGALSTAGGGDARFNQAAAATGAAAGATGSASAATTGGGVGGGSSINVADTVGAGGC